VHGSTLTRPDLRNAELFRAGVPEALWADLKAAGPLREDAPAC
jgi:hypothetical protein